MLPILSFDLVLGLIEMGNSYSFCLIKLVDMWFYALITIFNNFMSWRTRRLEFDSTAMHTVVRDVEALYGVQLTIDSDVIRDCPFTATFQNDTLEDVLETFKILFDAEVRQTDQGYRLIGGVCPTQSP